MKRLCFCFLVWLAFAGLIIDSSLVEPQTDSSVGQDPAAFTLHAYANLVQVPVLVLNTSRERMAPVDPKRFVVQLDSGRPFAPTHVRQEGDDPIALAVVIDNDGSRNELLAGLKDGIASLMPGAIHPQDSVSIYGVDCKLAHIAKIGFLNEANLRYGVEQALPEQANSAVSKRMKSCGDSTHLWNALIAAIRQIAPLPGRRVVLAVTNILETGNPKRWLDLKDYATSQGVAVFALSEKRNSPYTSLDEPDDDLDIACQMSGGMRIRTVAKNLEPALHDFMTILRERYIIDFPRPRSAEAQRIDIQVSLLKKMAFIRPAGVSFPIADPKLMSDPATVPPNPESAPEVGSRHKIKSH